MLVSVEELIKRGKEREKKKKFKVLVKELDREIECETVSRKEYLEIILNNNQDTDVEIIYNSCSVFRDDKLINELKCSMNPTEVVEKILSFSTIYSLAKTILEQSDISQSGNVSKFISVMDEDIKN
ncbi:regulator [Fusobacterium polymorphum]|uniref:regulator n=1 Tax=Fusobacterium nucleatum subsp. polymorphum TaxID=76857 RepID=UPI0030CFAD8C